LKCKVKNCGGTIVNMGWYYGCLLCCNPVEDKVTKLKINGDLIEVVGDKKIRHKNLLHLDPIHVKPFTEEEKIELQTRYSHSPSKYDPRHVLLSSGERYIGEE
jgi:hypothetical protein